MSWSLRLIQIGGRVINDLSEDILPLQDRINSRDDKGKQLMHGGDAEWKHRKKDKKKEKLKSWWDQQNEGKNGKYFFSRVRFAPCKVL